MKELSIEQAKLVAGGNIAADAVKAVEYVAPNVAKAVSPIAGPAIVTYQIATWVADKVAANQDAQIAAQRQAAEAATKAALDAAAAQRARDQEQERIDKQIQDAVDKRNSRSEAESPDFDDLAGGDYDYGGGGGGGFSDSEYATALV
jgi:hypothetical protein